MQSFQYGTGSIRERYHAFLSQFDLENLSQAAMECLKNIPRRSLVADFIYGGQQPDKLPRMANPNLHMIPTELLTTWLAYCQTHEDSAARQKAAAEEEERQRQFVSHWMSPSNITQQDGKILPDNLTEIIGNPDERMKLLICSAKSAIVTPDVPVERYFKCLDDMYVMASKYAAEGNIEKAFLMYLRFICISIDSLPLHADYPAHPAHKKAKLQEYAENALQYATLAKQMLQARYTSEATMLRADMEVRRSQLRSVRQSPYTRNKAPLLQSRNSGGSSPSSSSSNSNSNSVDSPGSTSPPLSPGGGVDISHLLKTPATVEAAFREAFELQDAIREEEQERRRREKIPETMCIPNEMIQKFKDLAKPDMDQNRETIGILFGTMLRGRYIVSHLLLPPQKTTSNESEITDVTTINDMVYKHGMQILGWIHTHPNSPTFMTCVDQHKHLPYQKKCADAVAIVCSELEVLTFKLTELGMDTVGKCDIPHGIHHTYHSSERHDHDQLVQTATHCTYSSTAKIRVLDCRTPETTPNMSDSIGLGIRRFF